MPAHSLSSSALSSATAVETAFKAISSAILHCIQLVGSRAEAFLSGEWDLAYQWIDQVFFLFNAF